MVGNRWFPAQRLATPATQLRERADRGVQRLMDVIEIAPHADVVGEVSVMRASSGPNTDVSDRKQVRGMSDVVDDQRIGSSKPACSANRVWLEYAAQFRIGLLLLVPARNPLVEVAQHDGSARSVGAEFLKISQPEKMFFPLLAILLTGLYMRGRPRNTNPHNVEWSSLGLCCSSDEAAGQRPVRACSTGGPFLLGPEEHFPTAFQALPDWTAPIGPGVDEVATSWKDFLSPLRDAQNVTVRIGQ